MNNPPAKFVVAGVCCSTEEGVLRKHLDGGLGADAYRYNPVTCELHIGRPVERARVLALVREAGFAAREKQAPEPQGSFLARHANALVTVSAFLLMCAGFLLGEFSGSHWGRAAHGAAILLGGARIFRRAIIALRSLVLDMNVLMSAAVVGAISIGRWEEGAAVVVLFAVALMLENYSAERTRRAVRSLLTLAPQKATVVRGGEEITVEAIDVKPGDLLIVRPGERIPIDGVVVEGESTVDESAITGESVPVSKAGGSPVTGGTVNERGVLRIRATRKFEETMVAHIVHLIEEAQQQRAPVQNFIDRFARIYTPVVFLCAIAVAALPPLLLGLPFETWLYRALVLLVIACPCALVISTPVTLVSALTNAARRGILIKGGKHLEALSRVHAMAFDKTGTLTRGRAELTDLIPTGSASADEVLRLAAVLERHSGHHLGVPVLEAARKRGIDAGGDSPEKFETLPGRGIRGVVKGRMYLLGSEELAKSAGAWTENAERLAGSLRAAGKSTMILAREGEALGVIAVRDTARAHSARTIQELKKRGIKEIVLLSGDHEAAVDLLAGELGVDAAESRMLPGEKAAAVRAMKERFGTVAMVGDGVNDAPALAASTVGIAMGVAGSDAALETADIVLISDDLGILPHLVALSRRTMAIIRQNIAIALGIKLLFLVLSVFGMSTLWMALLADDGAALAVILNGLRILSFDGVPPRTN